MNMMWGYGFNWLNMTLMLLGSILCIVFLIVIAWAVICWLNYRATSPTWQTYTLPASDPTAIEILSQRYAQGEIDAATFEQMRERLEGSENTHQRSWGDGGSSSIGERLFDGRAPGS